ncbi:hypothetical protein F5B17DRAFT_402428 [Nemania serpens]|nr:hypothetical protein F5B17DRAFT_402428 [Nemania serpens]
MMPQAMMLVPVSFAFRAVGEMGGAIEAICSKHTTCCVAKVLCQVDRYLMSLKRRSLAQGIHLQEISLCSQTQVLA